MIGTCSIFGGKDDEGMKKDTGLTLYEAWECNNRPDIFLPAPADNPLQETWKRLKTDFPYIALRFKDDIAERPGRIRVQNTPYRITNPKTGQWAVAWLVDRGPHESTGRLVDLSPGLARILRVETDDEVEVNEL